ncbi:MAG: metallophosphoesterase [Clostridiales bacterium]|nr:metallophosphoesterase [Clostridiales bacterium]
MSTFAISDLHGYPLEKFIALLDRVGFSGEDTLYVLGDVIDRNGDGGVGLLRYIMAQPNIEFLIGNHEDMLINCAYLFDEITDESLDRLSPMGMAYYDRWMRNGGGVTLESLKKLHREEPYAFRDLMQFLKDAPACGGDTVGGRDFLFVHGGLKDFSPEKKISDYTYFDVLWTRPKLSDEYFDDIITVFGHTPTLYYGDEYRGKVIKTRTWINIDAGAADGLPPALLRLDDLEVFYGE